MVNGESHPFFMDSQNSKTIRESLGFTLSEIAENSLHKTVEGKTLPLPYPSRYAKTLFIRVEVCQAYPFKNTLRLEVFYRKKAQCVQLACACLPIVVIGIYSIKACITWHIVKIWAFIAWLFVLWLI